MSDQPDSENITPTLLPAGVSLEDVLAALAAQSSSPTVAPSQAELDAITSLPFTADLVSPTEHNSRAIHCLLCATIILNPLAARHHTAAQHSLPPFPAAVTRGPAEAADGAVEHSWVVDDQMAFENVGVTRGAEGGVRYLVCGNCDAGPIGCAYADAPQTFYVVHGRIQYR